MWSGRIVFDAFGAIAEQHRFPPDFPTPEMAAGLIGGLLEHSDFYGIVAELDGRVVGSNFLDERSHITGLGPITVDPAVQNRTIGRRLMDYMLTRVRNDDRPGVRLLQATYHNRSLCLYTKLGFDTRALLSTVQGPALNLAVPECDVRPTRRTGRCREGRDGERGRAGGSDRGVCQFRRVSRACHCRSQRRTQGADRCCSVLLRSRIYPTDRQRRCAAVVSVARAAGGATAYLDDDRPVSGARRPLHAFDSVLVESPPGIIVLRSSRLPRHGTSMSQFRTYFVTLRSPTEAPQITPLSSTEMPSGKLVPS